jgi:hypothetical protein
MKTIKKILCFTFVLLISSNPFGCFGQENGNSNDTIQNATQWDRHGNAVVDTTEFIGTINQEPLRIKTGNNECMRITPDGRIGVGISNPLETFDVLGTIRSREDLRVDGNLFVDGTSNFFGEALFSGNVRMTGLQLSNNLSSGEIIVRGDDGLLRQFPLAELADFVYQPRLCPDPLDDPNWLPTWSHGPGRIYSLCARVGVFTDNPEHPLDINGHGQFRTTLTVNHRLSIGTETSSFAQLKIKNPNSSAAIQIDQTGNSSLNNKLLFMEYSNPSTEIIKVTGPNGHVPLLIDVAGNFRFSSPTQDLFFINANDQTVYSRRIVVDQLVWPDYVFRAGYQLMPLEEVKEYIEINGHLPNVPTEQEVVENGVDLADMNKILLEKIEELTLYIIQQQAEIEKIKTQLESKQ